MNGMNVMKTNHVLANPIHLIYPIHFKKAYSLLIESCFQSILLNDFIINKKTDMQIRIISQNITLSDEQEAMITEKVEKLSTYAVRISDESTEIKVDIGYKNSKSPEDSYSCSLTLFVPGDTLRAEALDGSLRNVVDDTVEKIKGQIERYKDKTQHISEHK